MLLVLNWKMNPQRLLEAKNIFKATKEAIARAKGVKAIVSPPATFLHPLAVTYKGRSIYFAVQNIHTEVEGAFTGDISAGQAKSAGAAYTLIGHAERRRAGETDEDIQKKVVRAFDAGLKPIICIGEQVRDHEGTHLEVIKTQLTTALMEVQKAQLKDITIAYEPVWAIGSDKPMGAREMHEMTIFIRKVLWEQYEKAAPAVPILYGGAILDESHALAMADESEIDGFLLGRMSVDAKKLPVLIAALGKK